MLIATLTAPILLWWIMVGKRDIRLKDVEKEIDIGNDVSEGISFHDDIIVIRQQETIMAYEAKCTHLGCRISKAEGDELVCPCHGSRFNTRGQAVKGPAKDPLKTLSVQTDPLSGNIIIVRNDV